jgi:carboxypeptidase C (cathepsin A)
MIAQQKTDSSDKSGPKSENNQSNLVFNPDQSVITEHTTIKGQKYPIKRLGTMPVWDEDGKQLQAYFTLIMNVRILKTNRVL